MRLSLVMNRKISNSLVLYDKSCNEHSRMTPPLVWNVLSFSFSVSVYSSLIFQFSAFRILNSETFAQKPGATNDGTTKQEACMGRIIWATIICYVVRTKQLSAIKLSSCLFLFSEAPVFNESPHSNLHSPYWV